MRILREDTAALLIDVQERLVRAMDKGGETVALTTRLIKGLGILEVPVVPMRQYPKGLGDFAPELREVLGDAVPYDKTTFSAFEQPEVVERLAALGKKNLVVFGMEAHVCVLQTAIDCMRGGYTVIVPTDCVASRFPYDREIALRRFAQEGALLTTSESLLFELLRKAGTESFKQISALVK